MNTFKIIFVPFLVFEKIVKLMGLIEVIELSQTSHRVLISIKFVKRKILPIKLEIGQKYSRIQISDYKEKGGGKKNFKLNFTFLDELTVVTRNIKIDKYRIGISGKKANDDDYPGYFSPLRNDYLSFLNDLFHIFSSSGLYLSIRKCEITENLLSHPILQKCVHIMLFEYNGTVLTQSELNRLLKPTKSTRGIILHCNLNHTFRSKEIFQIPWLVIRNANWVKIEDLMNMKCELIMLEEHSLIQNNMKKFIKHWMEGNNQTLFRIRLKKFRGQLNLENMLENIPHEKWNEKRRGRFFITHSTYSVWEKDCKNGWDFERSDGKLATIIQNSKHFEFLVWHDRFPTTTYRI